MKRNIVSLSSIALASILLSGCSDKFLEDKRNYDKVTSEVFDDYEGAKLRVNTLYGQCLPDPSAEASWTNNCTGIASDIQSKATEEYAGNGDDISFVNPNKELSSSVGSIVPDYFQNEQKHLSNVWGRIRGINDAIEGFNKCSLSEDQKNEMLGQCYFFRAWCYYQLVKWYGGVPIITEVQNTDPESFVQRSSAKACFEFILDDLRKAATLLEKATGNGGWDDNNWGRVTTGTALALKGRVLVLWASPMFNRANDVTRWTNAYNEMKADLPKIKACGYDLYTESGDVNGKAFAHMFAMRKSSEAVFVTLHNTIDGTADDGYNNQWERFIRPINTQLRAGSGQEASSMLVDLFPMKDGKKPKYVGGDPYEPKKTWKLLDESAETTDRECPFMDRDPRFYRTFAFPGVRWAYNGDASQGGANDNPSDGTNYALWNYVWYASNSEQDDKENGTRYGADNLLKSVRGIYVRKRTDDLDVNAPMYSYDTGASNGAFTFSGAPYIEIRFAEVLLNLAEAACGAGDMSYAVTECLEKIRGRFPDYYTAANSYGLQSNLSTNQAACMSAILYERMIELAYEGKRFDDLRRWMLYDGGANLGEIPGGAPATWTLTGWGGNTCTWLGYEPLNGQRRERMEFRVNDVIATAYGNNGTTYADDPLPKAIAAGAAPARPAPMDLNANMTTEQTRLKTWYMATLKRANKGGDSYLNHVAQSVHFFAKYYFLGLSVGAQNRNDSRLFQTIGWDDNKHGGLGTFDPLAE